MNNIKEKYSIYWETYEYPVDWKKLSLIDTLFRKLRRVLKEIADKNLHVSPHVKIRLSQGPLNYQHIEDIAIAAIEYAIEGSLREGFYSKQGYQERIEIYNENSFLVIKNWLEEKNQIDFVSAGVPGRRQNISEKVNDLGVTRRQFTQMSNDEKQEFFKSLNL